MSADTERLPPPNDAIAFESLCLDIWPKLWGDRGAQKNGRSGQPQAGVDIFGRHGTSWVGIQCKQKDGLLWSRLSQKELRAEVKKALNFKPKLDAFILATTGPRDATIQKGARLLTKKHECQDLFSVEVWSWEDIWHEIYKHQELLRLVKPIYWPRISSCDRHAEISTTRLRHGAEHLFGREEDIAVIDRAWVNQRTNILSIIAWGGIGKTSLVIKWMASKAERGWPGFDRIFDWSFYSQGTRDQGISSADTFIAEALKFFGDEAMAKGSASPWDKGERLAQLIAASRTLLVLDGLEPLQHPPGPLTGELKDPALACLLRGLAQSNSGLCIITSRERIADLAGFSDTTAPEWLLPRLTDKAGAEMLKALGVRGIDAECEKLVHEFGGHALTLNLLGRYLVKAHDGDIRRSGQVRLDIADKDFKTNPKDSESPYGHAFKVMMAYEKWLLTGGIRGQRQVVLLRLLGLFDRPADAGCLAALCQIPYIANLTELLVDLTSVDWSILISDLETATLVKKSPCESQHVRGFDEQQAKRPANQRGNPKDYVLSRASDDGASYTLDVHPLLREYFGGHLHSGFPVAWKEAHRRLYEHLKASAPFWPEGLNGLEPLYQAVIHGCQAGLEQQACDDVYVGRILRGREGPDGFYSTYKLGAFSTELGTVSCFYERLWKVPSENLSEGNRGWILNEAAFRLRVLGRLTKALEPMRAGMELAVRLKDWKPAAVRASNLSELQLTLGDLNDALQSANQSVVYSDRSEDLQWRSFSRTTVGDVLFQIGETGAAVRWFEEAQAIQAEHYPKYPFLYSLWGFRHCDALLASVEAASWRKIIFKSKSKGRVDSEEQEIHFSSCADVDARSHKMFEWRAPSDSLVDIGLDHLSAGRSALYRWILSRDSNFRNHDRTFTDEHLSLSVDTLRRSGDMTHIPRALLSRALMRFLLEDEAGAKRDLDDASEIAERGVMRLHIADIYLYRARLFPKKGLLQKAEELVVLCNYGRRQQELKDAFEAAQRLNERRGSKLRRLGYGKKY